MPHGQKKTRGLVGNFTLHFILGILHIPCLNTNNALIYIYVICIKNNPSNNECSNKPGGLVSVNKQMTAKSSNICNKHA